MQNPAEDKLVCDLQTGTGNFVAADGILANNCFLMLGSAQHSVLFVR